MSTAKWSSYGVFTNVILGAAVAPTLKNLANGSQKLGSEIDNSANRYLFADLDLYCRFVGAPAAGAFVELYLIPTIDGANYADGDDAVAPASNLLVGAFPVRATANQQRLALRGIILPPGKCKPLIKNTSGQNMTNTDNENILSYRAYGEEIV